jgi:hypothetical protein
MDGGSVCCKSTTYTQDSTNTEKLIQTCMTQVGFNLMTPAFKQVKTVHALDCTPTVISLPTISSNMKRKAYRSLYLPETLQRIRNVLDFYFDDV